ncbi:MAG: hypothetical protein Q7R47_05315 [Candidatus Diapherotrites archaeon]|nr:hypothetical protein [Candidatus Diapherotrites archaeon]
MTAIVFDSSVLISISEKCFLRVLRRFGEKNNVRFLVPESVFEETVIRPQSIRRFELNAVRLKSAVADGWLELVPSSSSTRAHYSNIAQWSNHLFFVDNRPLELLHLGELEALAVYKDRKADALAIDERTCRMMLEDPGRLRSLISKRQDQKIDVDTSNLKNFSDFFGKPVVVRSCDLLALAFRQGLFADDLVSSRQGIEAALWAVKFAGCAVSGLEIDQFVKGV